MKSKIVIQTALIVFMTISVSFKQDELTKTHEEALNLSNEKRAKKEQIRFDGLYIAKTGEIDIPNRKIEIYMYLRFYKDGSVCTQAVSEYSPAAVAGWFGKEGRFERLGKYNQDGDKITFTVSNNDSSDKKLEGAKTDTFSGKIINSTKLDLEIQYDGGKTKRAEYEFVAAEFKK